MTISVKSTRWFKKGDSMERLTRTDTKYNGYTHEEAMLSEMDLGECMTRLAEYEDTGLTPEEIQNSVRVHREMWEEKYFALRDDRDYWKAEALKHCAKLGETSLPEEQGLSIIFPCKIGDEVYTIIDSADIPYVERENVIAIEFWNKHNIMKLFIRTLYGIFEYGNKAFLTREEAEEALRKGAEHDG